jgi:flavin reductase (DIM6/NTAB) family NADH-FMN oxidoreductase RutF
MSAFDDLVALLDPAMVVVTTASGDEADGCLVGFHSQCSIEPERYALWLSRANRTAELAVEADLVAVHLLDRADVGLAALFGGETGDEVDKLARCEWRPGPGGVPLLAACPRRFVARRLAVLDADADHVCLVVAPLAAEAGSDDRGGAAEGSCFEPLRLSEAVRIEPGHEADDRPRVP